MVEQILQAGGSDPDAIVPDVTACDKALGTTPGMARSRPAVDLAGTLVVGGAEVSRSWSARMMLWCGETCTGAELSEGRRAGPSDLVLE